MHLKIPEWHTKPGHIIIFVLTERPLSSTPPLCPQFLAETARPKDNGSQSSPVIDQMSMIILSEYQTRQVPNAPLNILGMHGEAH
ncbi:hypothetical protein QCA50_005285 [Cerrena zonata]|uniref:Uncharacterized protein n=1 Tax=Cerrena zonata TaxID=2478898 RepID=A0AAW0GER2_9APHY